MPKRQRQVNETTESKMEQQTGNGTTVNGTAVKWNSSNKMERQSLTNYGTGTITRMYMFYPIIAI